MTNHPYFSPSPRYPAPCELSSTGQMHPFCLASLLPGLRLYIFLEFLYVKPTVSIVCLRVDYDWCGFKTMLLGVAENVLIDGLCFPLLWLCVFFEPRFCGFTVAASGFSVYNNIFYFNLQFIFLFYCINSLFKMGYSQPFLAYLNYCQVDNFRHHFRYLTAWKLEYSAG